MLKENSRYGNKQGVFGRDPKSHEANQRYKEEIKLNSKESEEIMQRIRGNTCKLYL